MKRMTNSFVPVEKLSKKQQKEYYSCKRANWNGMNPVTKVIPDKHKNRIRRCVLSTLIYE